jgi:hypothetical protein
MSRHHKEDTGACGFNLITAEEIPDSEHATFDEIWKDTVPKNSEALIRLEWRIRASRHTPVKEQFTGRQEYKGYKIIMQQL